MNPEEIKKIRKALKMTQEKFAAHFGVVTTTVNKWENGKQVPHGFFQKELERMKQELGL
jgi:DNA-binding transcriptional regulator YiaG